MKVEAIEIFFKCSPKANAFPQEMGQASGDSVSHEFQNKRCGDMGFFENVIL